MSYATSLGPPLTLVSTNVVNNKPIVCEHGVKKGRADTGCEINMTKAFCQPSLAANEPQWPGPRPARRSRQHSKMHRRNGRTGAPL